MIRRLLILAGAAVGALSLALVALCAWGATLPSDHTASGEREIPAPPELVFARITDPARYPHWRTGLRRVRLLNEDRWIEESTEGTLPFRFGARSRPSAVETIVDSTSLPFSGRWNFELEPLRSGRTRVRITERGTHQGLLDQNGEYASMWNRQREAAEARAKLIEAGELAEAVAVESAKAEVAETEAVEAE